ncbi:DoxX family protein [Geodermatophilus sp. DSM 45219]|uniref:DoxX family protein n=1 Tax=Geodermatophilus sp. DSM 45219 TaxID=1881103 RepID=UPI000ACB69B1|nr:DoxX family protein [Geodermatophilus sp. DSM 45219]
MPPRRLLRRPPDLAGAPRARGLQARAGGISKTFVPESTLAAAHGGEWTAGAGVGFVKALGVLELLAAVGLILPALVDVAPVMVPVTAVCWVALMIGAMITHARLGQSTLVVLNLACLALAAFIAWGRFGPESFVARRGPSEKQDPAGTSVVRSSRRRFPHRHIRRRRRSCRLRRHPRGEPARPLSPMLTGTASPCGTRTTRVVTTSRTTSAGR